MSTITVEPATAARFDDIQHALTGGGDGGSCQCQWWLMPNKEWESTSRHDRERMLHAEVSAQPPPALVAYVDGEAAGWVRVGPRVAQPRLARTRAFGTTPFAWDDPDVWAVTCFVVRREHRGNGVAERLLAAAVDHARACGARVVEAYPTDTEVAKKRTNELYLGVLSMFLAAGFREVARPKAHVAIVELDLRA